jgi:hypothetical protein
MRTVGKARIQGGRKGPSTSVRAVSSEPLLPRRGELGTAESLPEGRLTLELFVGGQDCGCSTRGNCSAPASVAGVEVGAGDAGGGLSPSASSCWTSISRNCDSCRSPSAGEGDATRRVLASY